MKDNVIVPVLYNAKEIFSKKGEMSGQAENFYLAEAFYKSRYDIHGKFSSNANSFAKNAGAVQIFNINGLDALTKPYSNISELIKISDIPTSYGHSERIGMRDLLDEFIPNNNKEIERPGYYKKSFNPKDHQLEILQELIVNSYEYQQYLTGKAVIVKMWSERKPCVYHTDKYGGKCTNFIDSIFPEGSMYGYITEVPKYTKTPEIAALNQINSIYLKEAYLEEVTQLGLINLFDDLTI